VVSGPPQTAAVISDVVGQRGGAYRATALLSEALADIGLRTTTFARWVEADFTIPVGRWQIIQPLFGRGSRWGWPERMLARQAAAWIRREQPSLVIVVGLTTLCSRLLPLAPANTLWVWELTNAEPGNKFVDNSVISKLSRAKGLLSPANTIDTAIRKNYGYNGPIERLPFWIENGPDQYLPAPDKFSCDFLFLSRREDDKGLADLIRAAALAADKYRHFSVFIAGAGNADKYALLSERLNVTDIVHFISLADRSDAMEVLAGARFAVLPSHHEGFPISILEGTQRSIPFITTPVGAIPEMLGSSVACCYHPVGNIEKLSQIMLSVLTENTTLYEARRRAAFETYSRLHSRPVVNQTLNDLAKATPETKNKKAVRGKNQ
jgi:glycosyltransferase involved in cell wall biosynthesis